ncbi:DCC-interacting protein 13-alpha isoform X3 [Ciona intestinalis]
MSNLLRLEDCLEDSPQTRALIGVYERDCDLLLNYSKGLNAACKRVARAQNELTMATQELAQKLRDFQHTKFSLTSEDDLVSTTIQQLLPNVDEISSYNTVLHTQLVDNMDYHSTEFVEKDLAEYLRLKSSFITSDKQHEDAAAKLAKISKKKPSEKGWQEATDALYASRKGFHNTSMVYCNFLNNLQEKKKWGILRPVVSFLQSEIGYFQMGSEICKKDMEETLTKLNENLTKLEEQARENRDLDVERMDRLDAGSTRSYIPDPPSSMDFPDLAVDRSRTQISGYLFYRSRGGLLSQWHRSYFFTQGGNLMQQSKREVAGQLFLDLDACTVDRIDTDDRRNAFQVISSDNRRVVVLQGESKHQYEEWMATIGNISAGLYLHDDPQSAVEAKKQDTAVAETTTALNTEESKPLHQTETPDRKSSSRGSSFETKHESLRPSMFERIKLAASSLINSDESSPQEHALAPPSEGSGDGSLVSQEMKIEIKEPILFDLPSPSVTTNPTPVKTTPPSDETPDPIEPSSVAQQQNNSDAQQQNNGVADNITEESAFKAMFVVRFLGCKRVDADCDLDNSISETLWKVMSARAYYKMFRMNELHLVVSDQALSLVDPNTQLSRETFPISSVLCSKTQADNTRLLGFVVQHAQLEQLMCYTFESNADGDDVCCALNTARVMQQSKLEHEENYKQKELEDELQTQSRMMRSLDGDEDTTLVAEDAKVHGDL